MFRDQRAQDCVNTIEKDGKRFLARDLDQYWYGDTMKKDTGAACDCCRHNDSRMCRQNIRRNIQDFRSRFRKASEDNFYTSTNDRARLVDRPAGPCRTWNGPMPMFYGRPCKVGSLQRDYYLEETRPMPRFMKYWALRGGMFGLDSAAPCRQPKSCPLWS